MKVKTYLKVSNPVERCLFINVSDISLKLFRGNRLRRSFKVIRYDSEKNAKSILEYVNRLNIKTIVIETSNLNHLPENLTNDIIDARLNGVSVYDAQEFYEIVNRRIPLVKLNSNEYLADDIFSIGLKHHSGLSSKRIIDVLIVLCILPFALPLILLGCLLTIVSSSGKVFFVQERIGKTQKNLKFIRLELCNPSIMEDIQPLTMIGLH